MSPPLASSVLQALANHQFRVAGRAPGTSCLRPFILVGPIASPPPPPHSWQEKMLGHIQEKIDEGMALQK
eukprot:5362194-Alexandrium_andersonii.AAC.1